MVCLGTTIAMKWEKLNRKEQSIQIIRILRSLSIADGALTHSELDLIRKVGDYYGLTSDEVDDELISETPVISVPSDENARIKILYYMLYLIKADQVIDLEEVQLVHHFGLKLGFRENMLDKLIDIAKENIGKGLPIEKMLDTIRQYLN